MRRAKYKPFLSEADMATYVVKWLQARRGCEVFQEIQTSAQGRRLDICGRMTVNDAPWLIAVECKCSMGEAVIQQAEYWLDVANEVYIAVPSYRGRHILEFYCKNKGIGILELGDPSYQALYRGDAIYPEIVKTRQHAELRGRLRDSLEKGLREEHKTTCAAGSASGGHWTPFRETCRNVAAYVAAHPGATLKETIGGIKHHYAGSMSARGAMRKWIEAGRMSGVRSEIEGRKVRLYPEKE